MNRRLHRSILRIALPSVVTNITVPLLGLVDLAIAGHIHDGSDAATVLGAIAVGGLIFNMVYWMFAFLRIGASGLTAQAYGRGDVADQRRVLRLGVAVGLACGLAIVGLQWPIAAAAHRIVAPSGAVWQLALRYFRIRILAAPVVLVLFAVGGWFIGMQNAVYPMVLAVVQNVTNIVVSAIGVFALGMGIEGIAVGTVAAQYVGLVVVAVMLWRRYRFVLVAQRAAAGDGAARGGVTLGRFFAINVDILLRMVCLIAVTAAVTALGARQGDLLLAVNTLLMQLFTLFSYFSDGFAAAGEALTGKAIGRRGMAGVQAAHIDRRLWATVRALFVWGGGLAVVFTLLYAAGGMPLLGMMTDDAAVLAAARGYLPWAVAIPLAGVATFVWDGIFIGATATRQMLASIALATAVFFAVYFGLPAVGAWAARGGLHLPHLLDIGLMPTNHRLWLAFVTYLCVRGIYQTAVARRVLTPRRERPCPT